MTNNPIKQHDHYGAEVQEALRIWQDAWTTYFNSTRVQLKENPFRLDSVQSAFNRLIAARKKETGVAFYLTKQQHSEAVSTLSKNKSPDFN